MTNKYLGEIDPNAIVRSVIEGDPIANVGDTFTVNPPKYTSRAFAYAYIPNCREGQGEWNNFKLLSAGRFQDVEKVAKDFALGIDTSPNSHKLAS